MTYSATPQQRDQMLDDARRLLDWLVAHPDLPINATGIKVTISVSEESDDAELAVLRDIAASAGVPITDVSGKEPSEDETHLYAKYAVGKVCYEATAIKQVAMDAHHAHADCEWVAS